MAGKKFPTLGIVSGKQSAARTKQVKAAQRRLNKSVYGDFLKLATVDGEYGRMTARATYQAKYWLGFPPAKIDGRYNYELHKYLGGKISDLPKAYLARRKFRIRKEKLKNAPIERDKKLLNMAISQLGYNESGNNDTKYGRWYGMNNAPWCAIGISWCFEQVGRGDDFRYAYVPYVVSDAERRRNGLHITNDPRPGDLVCFDFDGGVADHIGIFEKWIDKDKGSFYSIEGNTSPEGGGGSQSDGGGWERRIRYTSQVEAFVRVS